ncbi:hypothetical protein CPB85DRAFT_1431877 [Mucidula mucida]|nr:hypothetical protein CPB85DRAFT_1431877 [Mucidula mucida]
MSPNYPTTFYTYCYHTIITPLTSSTSHLLPAISLYSLGDSSVIPLNPSEWYVILSVRHFTASAYRPPQSTMITSSDSSLIIRLEQAAFSLAEEYEANALRRHELPIGEMGDPLSVAAIAQILLALPREVAVRSLTSSLVKQYGNIYETLVGQWCILRQRLEEGEDEKENAPPSFSMPTPLPEGRSASSVSLSP